VPFAWVLGDEVYGADRRLRLDLEQQERPFLLAIRSNEKLWSMLDDRMGQHTAATLAAAVPAEEWQRLSAGAGAKGERFYDWARVRLMRLQQPPWDHWLLVRRHPSKPDQLAYYVVFGRADTSLATLARVAGRRWAVEECFEVAKQEVGLADYEIRSRHGWYRHITLARLALAVLAVMRVKLKTAAETATASGKKGQPEPDLWSISAQMKSAISSAAYNSLSA
jgi:SRSO17 transposase